MPANTYAVINIGDLNLIDFTQVLETNSSTIFKNTDKDLFILKWNIDPSFITSGAVVPVQTLTYNEALTLVEGDNWKLEEFPPLIHT